MARAKKTKSDSGLSAEQRENLRRLGIHLSVAIVVVGAIATGAYFTKQYVEQKVVFPAEAPRVVLINRPVWMNDFVAARVEESIRPTGPHSAFDQQLLADRVKLLKANPWIKEIRQVRRAYGNAPGDTIEVDCDYRAPIALVKWNEEYWYVDADGVKLPEHFSRNDLDKVVVGRDFHTQMRVIEGVRRPPPVVGKVWGGDDLQAGIELARLLYAKPYADDIYKVDVSNFAGRRDPRESYLVLGTRYKTEIRWGRPYDSKDPLSGDKFIEVRVDRKLDYLSRVYAEFGRVDAKQPWIDIRFDKITYPSPEPAMQASGRG